MHTIEIGGVRYIKATDAAKQIGYAADYVGQLARAGKIQATQVGRAWYVREDELAQHKKGTARSNEKKTRAAVKEAIANVGPHEIHNVYYVPPPAQVSEFRKRLSDAAVRYERDGEPLVPQVHMHTEKEGSLQIVQVPTEPEVFKALEVDDVDHPKLPPRALDVIEKTENVILASQRPVEPPMHGSLQVTDLSEQEEVAQKEAENTKTMEIHDEQSKRRDIYSKNFELERGFKREHLSSVEVPVIALGRRKALSVTFPLVTALVPLLLFLVFALSFSGAFLQRVLVYQQGETMTAQPYYQAYYALVELRVFKSILSR